MTIMHSPAADDVDDRGIHPSLPWENNEEGEGVVVSRLSCLTNAHSAPKGPQI